MEIYLVRHGQTDWNYQGIVQGRENNPLNETGISQAREAAAKLAHITPSHLVASSLDRAYDTIKIMSEVNRWDLKINKNDNFVERDFGILEGKPVEEYKKVEDFSLVENCETNDMLEKRIKNGLNNIIKNSSDHEVIIVGCHSHVLKACLCLMKPKEYDYKYSLDNCAILKLDVVDQRIVDISINI